ncbi:bis(5'-nucleosyl)-tetraphosphatase (symmetrical) YqeK [Oscillospiraceae bacterium MB08-C2-2]|nr:bis(5'-nucleosyl)-tetraphosphatase (symmetrical) YqeK [Oscillospiraceae bacterium MB08-C2-2]
MPEERGEAPVYDLEFLRDFCRRNLSPSRYIHSMAVQRQAAVLAPLYGADPYKAAVAGLLHDITHCWEPWEQLKYMGASGIMLTKAEKEHPPIWHAKTGSHLVWHELGIRDPEIGRAIRYHTTGRADMTPLELAVCLGDKTSADRIFPDIEVIRELALRSSHKAMAYYLQHTMDKLIAQGGPFAEDFLEAYDYYALHAE